MEIPAARTFPAYGPFHSRISPRAGSRSPGGRDGQIVFTSGATEAINGNFFDAV